MYIPLSVNFASAFAVSFNSANAFDESRLGTVMADANETSSRVAKVASVLRPLGRGPLSREQAILAGRLLGVHWTTVYRLRRRYLADPVASSVAPHRRGQSTGGGRLGDDVDKVIDEVVHVWLPRQRQLVSEEMPVLGTAGCVPAPVVWTRFCSSGRQLHQPFLTGFEG